MSLNKKCSVSRALSPGYTSFEKEVNNMLFHASQRANLTELIPHISNHNKALVYLSSKRENSLVYLSNAVEQYCKEIGYQHIGVYRKWASYGFSDGILLLEEYYPNAIIDTYKGVPGYIYSMGKMDCCEKQNDIPFAYTSSQTIQIENREFIQDAYESILSAVKESKIRIKTFEEQGDKKLNWIKNTIENEYKNAKEQPDYRLFLKAKFPHLFQ